MFTVDALWTVLVLELLLGIAIGGDYAIGSPLLGEGRRGRRTAIDGRGQQMESSSA